MSERRLKSGVDAFLMLGLARAYRASNDDRERHWLQLNGLCWLTSRQTTVVAFSALPIMGSMPNKLTDPWMLGPLEVPNRVLLAPLAGIGNWFVRLQAKRYGAGMAVSEMVSTHAITTRTSAPATRCCASTPTSKTVPRGGGPGSSIQLFGEDPEVMRAAAARVAAAGADVIDINMGCPVPKVQKTGAGAALLADPDLAVAVARAAREGSEGLPVTVKLRSGRRPGETSGFELAHRLVAEAGVAAIGFHPARRRSTTKASPTTSWPRAWSSRCDAR